MKLKFTVKWNEDKNEWLKTHRGISFEAVVAAIENDRLLGDVDHPGPNRKHQRMLVVELDGYACAVPYVVDGITVFLKTAFRSRDMQKRFMGAL
jgi:hypothetical protein